MINAIKHFILVSAVCYFFCLIFYAHGDNFNAYTLSPRSALSSNPLSNDDQVIEELKNSSFISEKEKFVLSDLKALAQKFSLPMSKEETQAILSDFHQKHAGTFIIGNLSLYHPIEEIYNNYDKIDPYSEFLYAILFNISMTLPVWDIEATGISENLIIRRETRKNRLQNTLPLIAAHINSSGEQPVIYDLGASFGTESLSLFENYPDKKNGVNPYVVMSDINIYQNVVYDIQTGSKIYFNALNQAMMIVFKNGAYTHRDSREADFSQFDKTDHKFRDALGEKSKHPERRYLRQGQVIVETVVIADPHIKFYQKLGAMQILQHDVKNPFPKDAKAPHAIRICNLLQYFKLPAKTQILKNLLRFLAPEGILIFNFNETTEDSKHLIVLKKQADGKIELIVPQEYSASLNKTSRGIFTRIKEAFNDELADIRQLLMVLNETPAENITETFQSPLKREIFNQAA